MAKVITITYTAPVAPKANAVDQICRYFRPDNAAADNAVFAGTYYDTNVDGWGQATSFEDFLKNSIAHPGLIAAFKKAAIDGSYEFKTDDEKEVLYLSEVAGAVLDQGFVVEIAEEE